jgi:hypothetical protein
VARVAAVVNSLTRFPDGAFSCPAESGGQMRLTFSTRPGGPVVARLTAQYGGCGIVSVRIGGRDMPGLSALPRSGLAAAAAGAGHRGRELARRAGYCVIT